MAASSSSTAQLAVDILSGFAAGLNVTLVGHPFDTVKLRLQTQPSPPNAIYGGFVDCVRKTVAWEGPLGLYKGVGAPLAGQLFFRSALFMVNAEYGRAVAQRGSPLSAISPSLGGGGGRPLTYADYALGGSVAWGLGALIECPLNVAASQMQVQIVRQKTVPGYVPEFRSVTDYATTAPVRYGVGRALYAGFGPHLTRNLLGGALHFGAFEAIRREYAARIGKPVAEIGLAANLVAGSVGGLMYWLWTYPVDVVKGVLQGDELAPGKRRYAGAIDAARKLWAEGGAARFTRGFSACILRAAPANAVLLTTAFRVKELGYAWVAQEAKGK